MPQPRLEMHSGSVIEARVAEGLAFQPRDHGAEGLALGDVETAEPSGG